MSVRRNGFVKPDSDGPDGMSTPAQWFGELDKFLSGMPLPAWIVMAWAVWATIIFIHYIKDSP